LERRGERGGEGEDGDKVNVPQVFVLRHGLLHAGFNLMEGSFVGGGEGGAVFIAGLFGLVVVRCSEVLVWGYGKGMKDTPCAGEFELRWLLSVGHCRLGTRRPSRTLSGFFQCLELVSAWRCLLLVPLWSMVYVMRSSVSFKVPSVTINLEIPLTCRMQEACGASRQRGADPCPSDHP
jgi:hypothetical protein